MDAERALYRDARVAFDRAQASAGSQEFCFRIADAVVRLQFAGEALLSHVTRALAHNACAAATPDFTIRLWDATSTGVDFPPVPWRHGGVVKRGEIAGWSNEHIRLAVEAGFGGISLMDARASEVAHALDG